MKSNLAHKLPPGGDVPDGRRDDARARMHQLVDHFVDVLVDVLEPGERLGSRDYSRPFFLALATLTSRGVAAEHAAHVLAIWCRVAALQPPEPHILLNEEGAVAFEWNTQSLAASLEVHSDGGLEWWTFDRAADLTAGTNDDRVTELPDEFWSFLARLPRP